MLQGPCKWESDYERNTRKGELWTLLDDTVENLIENFQLPILHIGMDSAELMGKYIYDEFSLRFLNERERNLALFFVINSVLLAKRKLSLEKQWDNFTPAAEIQLIRAAGRVRARKDSCLETMIMLESELLEDDYDAEFIYDYCISTFEGARKDVY